MIPSSDARRTVASTCAEGMIATSIATGASASCVRLSGRGALDRRGSARDRATIGPCPRRCRPSPTPPIRSASCSAGSARATCGRWTPTAPSPTRCSCTASSTTRAGTASSTTATTTTRRSRSTSASTSRRWRAGCATAPTRTARRRTTSSRVLGRMAIRGHDEARRVLREYVAYGVAWARARRGARRRRRGDAVSGPPWPEVVAGLDDGPARALRRRRTRSTRRSPGSTRASARGRCGRSRTRASRGRWRSTTATAPRRAKRAWRPRERQVKPHEMYTVELLRDRRSPRAGRRSPRSSQRARRRDDVRAARRRRERARTCRCAARRSSRSATRAGARCWRSPRQTRTQAERGKLQGAIALALEAMPLSQTRALAHDWLARRRLGAAAQGGRACSRRGPRTRTSRRRAARWRASSTAAWTATSTSSARWPRRSGAAPCTARSRSCSRAYEEIPYSYGRRYVVVGAGGGRPDVRRRRRRRVPVGLRARDAPARRRARRPPRPPRRASACDELAGDEAQAASVRTRQRRSAERARPAGRRPRPPKLVGT